ncbi:MAG: hypothetical protein MI922_04835, partial [Bacteroidales bacterium]|nr:hypothetical protein [Bacteroidales bacterium]
EGAAVKLIETINHPREWQEVFEHMADDNGPVQIPRNKDKEDNINEIAEKQMRMEKNELWLKTHLLKDVDDWEDVIAQKKKVFNL